MKFTLSWLKEHLHTEADLENIILALTDLGLEVESVTDPVKQLEHFVVGEIVDVDQHPNADRLKVCQVSIGSKSQQIICGAPNVHVGMKVVVAKPGDYIPGLDTVIKVGKIRGIESHGMMCSEKELLISNEHEGIIKLDNNAPVGGRFVDQIDHLEVTIDIAVTPNRSDALGVRGVARDLAAKGLGQLKSRKIPKIKGSFKSPLSINIDEDVIDNACPLFIGRYFRGITNTVSPNWLQNRLIAIGLRPISALVDITNFVTYDSARPLHVFDASKLSKELLVRKAKEGERIHALDGSHYELDVEDTVISSGNRVESLAGIIGGIDSGCDTGTTNVFLESAYFDPITTAKTGRKLRINSDARYRFERGVDPLFVEQGIDLATQLILDICGGEVSHLVEVGQAPYVEKELSLRPDRAESLVGMRIPKKEQERILKALGFAVVDNNNLLIIKVPSWRPDIFGEADLIEEIVRVTSLEKLEGVPLKKTHSGVMKPVLNASQKRISRLRRGVVSQGMNECISYSFIHKKDAELFSSENKPVMLLNPISSEMTHMRPSILPGLLRAVKRNQARSYNDLKLFEIGEVFFGKNPGEQSTNLAGIFSGNYLPKNSFSELRDVDVFDAKKIVELALRDMDVSLDNLLFVRERIGNFYHPGRASRILLGPKNVLASFGELHPRIVKHFDLRGPIIAFEIYIDNVPFPKKRRLIRQPITMSEFQPVERDFAFVVENDCEIDSIKKAIIDCEKELITDARVFDIFEGEAAETQLGKNKKSVAFMVRLQPTEATFTDNDLELVSQKLIDYVKNITGATLRS